ISSPSLKIPSRRAWKASDQVVEPFFAALDDAAVKGSGRTLLTGPNNPDGEVKEASLRAMEPTCLSTRPRSESER
ncbi:hypothetical protein OIDMADRAFT_122292, partial [Oidiodendron maius Zn]